MSWWTVVKEALAVVKDAFAFGRERQRAKAEAAKAQQMREQAYIDEIVREQQIRNHYSTIDRRRTW